MKPVKNLKIQYGNAEDYQQTKYLFLLLLTLHILIANLILPYNSNGQIQTARAASDPVIAAAGDIACDPASSSFKGGNGTSTNCRQKYTSDLLVNAGLAGVLMLGDSQYACGSFQAFMQSYDPSWGRVKSITYPIVGNHEYMTTGGIDCTSANTGAAGYFDYFGAAAGPRGQGYYSYDIGEWHIIALNSNCTEVGGCGTSSPQGQWLQADLAAHTNMCTLAYFHHPLFSSGTHSSSVGYPFWQLLYQYNADVILSGHDHLYERFAPQNPSGAVDPQRGIRQFTVGTGGDSLHAVSQIAVNSEARNDSTYGVLKLTLHPTSYDWEFVPEAGKTYTDSGSALCHDAVPPTPTPIPTLSQNPMLVSFASNGSVGGISFADEDIVKFDGQSWSLFFDGSDVGVGGSDLFAFSVVDLDTFLMSFSTAVTVNGISATPQDVLRFEATSLGVNTAGTFYMYLDGSDVGLDTSGESIDSISLLPDSRVLISTTGNPVVPGVSGKDEDVLVFTPVSLGDVTSGIWTMYFDGSDVGLAETSGEDVDALDVTSNGYIYLSTLGDFGVNGLVGADEDIFICVPSSLGNTTACSYLPTFYFDGSTWGLDTNDVDAFNFLTVGPVSTATPSSTPTRTPTATVTRTSTLTLVSTNTSMPNNTPTPTLTLAPTNTPLPTSTPTLGPSSTATNTLEPTAAFTPTYIPTVTATFTSTATFTASPTPALPDLIFSDGFESGNFSAWSSNKTDFGDLGVTAAAALTESNGMQVVVNDTNSIYVADDTPVAELRYRARFYFDPNSIAMLDPQDFYIFTGYDTTAVFQVQFGFSAGSYRIRLRQNTDNATTTSTAWTSITDSPHVIEVEWHAASSVGTNNGGATLWVDGVASGSLGGLDNDTRRIEFVRLGAISGLNVGTLGMYYLDAFESRRESFIGP